jgi:hypothetical protein
MVEREIGLLRRVQTIIQKYETVRKLTGGFFNIFAILKMDRDEVRTHSGLLYELLNPKGSHKQGPRFLKYFLSEVLNVNDLPLDELTLQKERFADEEGRIDITIESSKRLYVIENKIDARGGKEQLKRYYDFARRQGKEPGVFYLTLQGETPSEDGNEVENYTLISYKNEILNWLELCIREVALIPGIRETLVQYRDLLKRLTNQNEQEDMTMEIADVLREGNNLELAESISRSINDAKAKIQQDFWEQLRLSLVPKLKPLGLEFVLTGRKEGESFYHQLKKRQETIKVRLECMGLESRVGQYRDHTLMLGILEEGNDAVYLSFYPADAESDEARSELKEAFRELHLRGDDVNLAWKYIPEKSQPINFYNDSIYKIADKKDLEKVIGQVVDETIEIVHTFKRSGIPKILREGKLSIKNTEPKSAALAR